MKCGGRNAISRICIIAVLLGSIGLIPSSAKTYDVDPWSRWWRNEVTYVFESSIPVEWYSYISQAADAWSIQSANSWFRIIPYYSSAVTYGFIKKEETNVWYNCNGDFPACAPPGIASGYLYDYAPMNLVYDDDVYWTLVGNDDCSTNTINVKNISLHEFGHWLRLGDQPNGHSEAVLSWGCDNKTILRQDDRDGIQYLYGTQQANVVGWNGIIPTLQAQGGQAHWLRVNGTATDQYWTARGRAQATYQLGPIFNAGSNNRWTIDVDVYLNGYYGTGWSPQLYMIDTGGRWLKVGWMKDTGYSNPVWFVQSSNGSSYWGTESGGAHHFKLVYNPSTKFVSWVVDVTPMWSDYIQFDNPYVLQQGIARAVGDQIDVTFKNFRITTEWSPN